MQKSTTFNYLGVGANGKTNLVNISDVIKDM